MVTGTATRHHIIGNVPTVERTGSGNANTAESTSRENLSTLSVIRYRIGRLAYRRYAASQVSRHNGNPGTLAAQEESPASQCGSLHALLPRAPPREYVIAAIEPNIAVGIAFMWRHIAIRHATVLFYALTPYEYGWRRGIVNNRLLKQCRHARDEGHYTATDIHSRETEVISHVTTTPADLFR